MIENIRKYTGLMIVVLVLLFIGLVFMENSAQNLTSGKPALEVAGKQISQKEFQREAKNPLDLAGALPYSPLFGDRSNNQLSELVLFGQPRSTSELLSNVNYVLEGDEPDRFLANRIAIQKAGIEFGATPGAEEVDSFIRNILFADLEGNFDREGYDDFLKERIGRLGIGNKGFRAYIRDILTAANLSRLISGGLEANSEMSEALYRNARQTITAEEIILESASYEGEQNPTEEEIKAYWEENQANYNTPERRSASYVFFEPDWDAALASAEKEAAEVKKAQEEQAAKLKEEAKKAEEAAEKANAKNLPQEEQSTPTEIPETPAEGAEGEVGAQGEPAPPAPTEPAEPTINVSAPPATSATPAPEPPPIPQLTSKDKLTGAQRQKALASLIPQADEFYDPLVVIRDGTTFEEQAAKQGLTVIKTELFEQAKAPKQLELFATDSMLGQLSSILFAIESQAKDDQRITEPYTTTDGIFIGQLEEVEASRPLTYEEAKVKATVDLKKKLAREKLATEAPAIRERLAAAISGGQTFAEAAKAEKLDISKLPNLRGPQNRNQPASPAFDASRYTDPGTIAEVKFLPNEQAPERAFLVFVENREITIDEEYQTGFEAFKTQVSTIRRISVFQNWLRERYLENEVIFHRETQGQ